MAKYILPPLPGYFVKFAAKTHLCFSPCCRFILLACDGLFKVFTPEEAVNFILSCLEDEKIQRREGKPTVDARYEAACNRLANKAVQRGSADNVTVMVVRIGL